MTLAEQKQIVREQREGFDLFRRLELDSRRKMTFEDRLDAFNRITALSPHLQQAIRDDDDQVTQTWTKIRERYESARR